MFKAYESLYSNRRTLQARYCPKLRSLALRMDVSQPLDTPPAGISFPAGFRTLGVGGTRIEKKDIAPVSNLLSQLLLPPAPTMLDAGPRLTLDAEPKKRPYSWVPSTFVLTSQRAIEVEIWSQVGLMVTALDTQKSAFERKIQELEKELARLKEMRPLPST